MRLSIITIFILCNFLFSHKQPTQWKFGFSFGGLDAKSGTLDNYKYYPGKDYWQDDRSISFTLQKMTNVRNTINYFFTSNRFEVRDDTSQGPENANISYKILLLGAGYQRNYLVSKNIKFNMGFSFSLSQDKYEDSSSGNMSNNVTFDDSYYVLNFHLGSEFKLNQKLSLNMNYGFFHGTDRFGIYPEEDTENIQYTNLQLGLFCKLFQKKEKVKEKLRNKRKHSKL